MSTISRWLDWTPSRGQIMETFPSMEPTKPTKPSFDGFVGSVQRETPIMQGPDSAAANLKGECPYPLPQGVKLLRYERKAPPVAVTVCSVVMDIPKFIQHALGALDARLHHPVQIKAGDSVFELLSKLADAGLELRLEWPPERIIGNPPESEPTKPAKLPEPPKLNARGVDITDADIPF